MLIEALRKLLRSLREGAAARGPDTSMHGELSHPPETDASHPSGTNGPTIRSPGYGDVPPHRDGELGGLPELDDRR